jgi:uncharacterized membrane protein (DUF373 family)
MRMEDKPIGERLEQDAAQQARISLREELRRYWQVMTVYERFEQLVALVLSLVIAVVIVVAVVELVEIVLFILINEPLNLMQSDSFQLVFGMIMTVLIALEFKHSIVKVALRRDSIIQVKTVILIALLALARKFVILDVHSSPAQIAALAASLLALGAVYGIVRKRDRRRKFGPPPPAGEQAPPLAPGPGWKKEGDRLR